MNPFFLFQTTTTTARQGDVCYQHFFRPQIVVVAVKSSSSRSGDSFSRVFFLLRLFANQHAQKSTQNFLFFYSSLSSLLMSVRQTTARTERNDGTDCSSFFHSILVAIFNGVSALLPFTSRLFRTNTPPRRFFASI